jgi:acyl transferase domain-containing protein
LVRRPDAEGCGVLRGRPVVLDAVGEVAVFFPSGPGVVPAQLRALYGAFSPFREQFDAVSRVVDGGLPVPLAAAVFAPPDSVDAALLHRAAFRRTALFAYQVALFAWWRQCHALRAAAVAGEGAGGCAAGYVGGVLDLNEAVPLLVSGHGLPESGVSGAELNLRAGGFESVVRCGPGRQAFVSQAAAGHAQALHRPEACMIEESLSGE